MARLTVKKAAGDLAYIDRERAAGRMNDRLAEIEQHRLAFLAERNVCRRCHRECNPANMTAGYGPDCIEIVRAEISAEWAKLHGTVAA